MRTRAGVPGLKRQRRKAETVELSKIGLPMLCSIVTSMAKPAVGINADHGDAAPGNMAAARFVWVIRPRRAERERLRISHCG